MLLYTNDSTHVHVMQITHVKFVWNFTHMSFSEFLNFEISTVAKSSPFRNFEPSHIYKKKCSIKRL